MLAEEWSVGSEVFSVTSFSELARDARDAERWNRLHPGHEPRQSHVAASLSGDAPIVAATDYVRSHPQSIASYLRAPFVALGTDGFGRSDTRAALRRFFEVDRAHIVVAALDALHAAGALSGDVVQSAIGRYALDDAAAPPWQR
jgi:pyruvate dehydrogenase E1 component